MKPRHFFLIFAGVFGFFFLLHFGVTPWLANLPGEVLPQPRSTFVRLPGGSTPGSYDFFDDFVPSVVLLITEVAGAAMLGFLIYAGILLVINGVDEGYREKAKNIFMYVVIGAIIISISYALVIGISRIDFIQ